MLNNRVKATPAARRIAQERRINLSAVLPAAGRDYIRQEDVLAFRGSKATPLAQAIAEYHGLDLNRISANGNIIRKIDVLHYLERGDAQKSVPVQGMRKVIAQRMMESISGSPQYSMFMDFDMFELLPAFRRHQEQEVSNGAPKPTLSDLFIKLFAEALQKYPIVNSTFTQEEILLHRDINIGLAVAVEEGLTVPNIKNADQKSLRKITRERIALVEKARAGRLSPNEYSGGTFTISNLGGFPVEYATPVINQPESAIVVVGTTVDKIIPHNGQAAIHPVMGMSFTFDHRHLDGAVGGAFMKVVKDIFVNAPEILANEKN